MAELENLAASAEWERLKGEEPAVPVTLLVSPELLEQLRDWSPPVQARLVETPGVGTGWDMELRTVPRT